MKKALFISAFLLSLLQGFSQHKFTRVGTKIDTVSVQNALFVDSGVRFRHLPAATALDTTNNKLAVIDAAGNIKRMVWQVPGGSGSSSAVIFSATASGSAVTNTTTPTVLSGTGVGSRTIAANSLSVGKQIVLHGWVLYSTGLTSTTIDVIAYEGSSGLGTAFALPTSQTNAPAEFTITYTVLTTGSGGTVALAGNIFLSGAATQIATSASTAFDTTISHTMDVQVIWTTASTSNSINMLPIFTVKVE